MSDLPDRLRAAAHERYFNKPELLTEAADRIEWLEANARCPYVFPCGCQCQLPIHEGEEHER